MITCRKLSKNLTVTNLCTFRAKLLLIWGLPFVIYAFLCVSPRKFDQDLDWKFSADWFVFSYFNFAELRTIAIIMAYWVWRNPKRQLKCILERFSLFDLYLMIYILHFIDQNCSSKKVVIPWSVWKNPKQRLRCIWKARR